MPIARLLIPKVRGYAGPARCYVLDPPVTYRGVEYKHVTIWLTPPKAHMEARVFVTPATETGAPAEGMIAEKAGSFTPAGNPFRRPDHLEGCFAWALATNGYELGPPIPPPVTLTDVPRPHYLTSPERDYDVDDVPTYEERS